MQRFGLRDDQWERIKDLLPGREGHVGGNAADNRLFVDAVLYRYRTGVPWRDSPARFGDWNIVYQRFNRWRCEVHHKEQVAPAENRAARCLLDKLPLPIIDNSGIPETCSLQHHQVRRRDVANGKNKVEVERRTGHPPQSARGNARTLRKPAFDEHLYDLLFSIIGKTRHTRRPAFRAMLASSLPSI